MAALTFAAALTGEAETLPNLKPGLWEVTMKSAALEAMGPEAAKVFGSSKMCVDAATSELMLDSSRQLRQRAGVTCDYERTTASGASTVLESLCGDPMGGKSKQKTRVVITFKGENAFENQVEITYVPERQGEEVRASSTGRWLGPCEPGQRPGDVVLGNGSKMNMLDMLGAAAPVQKKP